MITPYPGGKTPGRGRIPTSAMETKDKARIWFLGIGFVLVLGIFLGLRIWGQVETEKERQEEEEQGEIVDPVLPVGNDGQPVFQVKPQSPPEHVKSQVAPEEHVMGQSPPVQLKVQAAPEEHVMSQSPPVQWKVQVLPWLQVILQSPTKQL